MTYTCKCGLGYTGSTCDMTFNPCDDGLCYSNGTTNCTFVFPASFKCHFKDGWVGELCSTAVNEWESSLCLHGGICEDLVEGYRCDCPLNYFGERCESSCDSGFEGSKCEIRQKRMKRQK